MFVRFYNETKKELCEELFGITHLEAHTQGEDIHEVIKGMLTKRGIDLKSVVFITTDEAPAMIGRGRGLVAHLKEDHPDLHYPTICVYSVMTMMMTLKLLREQHHSYNRHSETFWQRPMPVLMTYYCTTMSDGSAKTGFWNTFFSIEEEIKAFLSEQKSDKATQFSEFLVDEKMERVVFLTDITSHLNQLNAKLQGQNNTVCDMITAVKE